MTVRMAQRYFFKDPRAEKKQLLTRLACAIFLMLLGFSALLYRYYDLQIVQYEKYRTASDRNRVQLRPVPPKRGLIFDRNGVLLAENVPSYSLTVVLEQVENLDAMLTALHSLIALDDEDIQRFQQRLPRRRPFEAVPLKFRLTEEEIAVIAVNRHRLPGVDIDAQLVRHYPHGELFAHVVGYIGRINEAEQRVLDPVNYAGTHYLGKIGVERYYEEVLHGQVGNENVETNARGRVLRVLERTDPMPGQDLVLHLDIDLQRVATEALRGLRGAVVAIDTRTGGVLALVSTPSYDANLFVNGISRSDYQRLQGDKDLPLFNRALQGQYPPASTVKPIFALAGLHYGIVTPQTRVRDPGWYQLPNDTRRYRDWKRWGHGESVNMEEAVAQSCDTYFYDLAHRLDIDRLHEFTVQFGFGAITGIDSTSEQPGLMPSRQWKREVRRQAWFPGETLSVGIGQGAMLATPLQLAVATVALANHGRHYTPQLVREVGGSRREPMALPDIQVAKEGYWQVMTDIMEAVVHGPLGTARSIGRDAPYRIAGKTGTSQVIGIAQDARYDRDEIELRKRDHALFVSFAPVEEPRIAVAVLVENGEHGSTVAAPVARKVMDAWLLRETDPHGDPPLKSAQLARQHDIGALQMGMRGHESG